MCVIKQTPHQIHLLCRYRSVTQKVRVGISIQYCALASNHLGYWQNFQLRFKPWQLEAALAVQAFVVAQFKHVSHNG